MADPIVPRLGDIPKTKDPFHVTRSEALTFLGRKRLPVSKKTIRRAKAKLRKRKERQSIPRGRDISLTATDVPRQIVYGDFRVAPVLTFVETNDGKRNIHIVATVAGHEVESIDDLWIDGNKVTFGLGSQISPADPRWATGGTRPDGTSINYDSKVFMAIDRTGTDNQGTQGELNSFFPSKWTNDHRQRGCAYAYILMVYDGTLFPEGNIDNIEIGVHGKKVYDPRTTSTAWSNNAALCIADFLMDSRYGPGFSLSEIDVGTDPGGLAWAANICDQSVAVKGGGTLPRYALNGVFDADMTPDEILADMVSSFAGHITFENGKWRFFPGAYVAPSITLTIDDLRGAPTIETLISRRDNFNSIRGTFPSYEHNYEVTDFPPISLSSAVSEDGEELWEDISLPCTTAASMAQRIAMIEVRRQREAITFTAPFGMRAYPLMVGETVMLDMDRYGFSSKVFEVVDHEHLLDANTMEQIVELVLRETSSGVYDWNEATDEQDFHDSPNTTLPDPFVADAPTGLTLESGTSQLVVQSDGTIVSRLRASWTSPDDAFVLEGGRIEVQLKESSASKWREVARVRGDETETFVLGLKDGVSYDIRIRSVNAIGATSSWVTQSGHTLVGKTEPPPQVPNFTARASRQGTLLKWDRVDVPDFSHYEIRRGYTVFPPYDWNNGEVVARVSGTMHVDPFFANRAEVYAIKAVDTTGNKSEELSFALLGFLRPGQVEQVTTQIIDNHALLRWGPPTVGSYDVDYYNVYKGDSFGSATRIGRVYGTFFSYFALSAEEVTFWIEAVDVGGNKGVATSRAVKIMSAPNFVLEDTGAPSLSDGTLTNAIESDAISGAFVAPVVTGESWEDHFTSNSFDTIQDYIDAGLTTYLAPANSSTGSFEFEIDLGTVLSARRVSIDFATDILSGSPAIATTVSYRETSGDAWTDVAAQEAYATDFRYLKFRIDISSPDDNSLARISNITWRVDVRTQTDSGTATSDASNATTVNFNLAFVDVTSIQVTPKGDASSKYTAVYDFDDSPNPTSFDVYIFDLNGNQVAVDFSWSATGVIEQG